MLPNPSDIIQTTVASIMLDSIGSSRSCLQPRFSRPTHRNNVNSSTSILCSYICIPRLPLIVRQCLKTANSILGQIDCTIQPALQ